MLTQEQKIKIITEHLRKDPYILALRKAFGVKWYHKFMVSPSILLGLVKKYGGGWDLPEHLTHKKCFNRENWLIKLLRKSRYIRNKMTMQEIKWELDKC
ncbi:MAG: hypothetical protein WC974_09430 [Thermoplasmata archaeon]